MKSKRTATCDECGCDLDANKLCKACSQEPQFCSDCDCELDDWAVDGLCEKCAKESRAIDERDELIERVEAAAAEHGWDVDESHRAQTGSSYLEMSRADDSFKVRVSDHSTCYCSEEISLVIESGSASPDDHTFDDLLKRLS